MGWVSALRAVFRKPHNAAASRPKLWRIEVRRRAWIEGLPYHKRKFAEIVVQIASRTAANNPDAVHAGFELVFVGPKRMHRLNALHRDIDAPTDVIAFADQIGCLGSVVVCLDKIREYNPDQCLSVAMYKTLIHGVLHTYGYDHHDPADAAKMLAAEERVYREVCELLGVTDLVHDV